MTPRPAVPTVPSQRVLCPYCGEVSTDPRRCDVCRGFFDPLSRQATQNAMGPWFIRDTESPFRPGCSIETLRELIRRGKVTRDTIIRGPSTKQFWNFAGRTPSIANLLGLCHNCRAAVRPDDYSCKACGAVFSPDPDRQHLGLAPMHILPGEASPEIVAAASLDTPAPVPAPAPTIASQPPVIIPPPIVQPTAPQRPSQPKPRRNRGPVLVGVTVVIIAGMATALALIASGAITIPWLTETEIAPTPSPTKADAPAPPMPAAAVAQPAATAPIRVVHPGPEQTPTESPSPPAASVDLKATLEPLLAVTPFDEAAMLAKIEELRRANPTLAEELDSWAAAARARADLKRLRQIP